jgi:hypothetical protein
LLLFSNGRHFGLAMPVGARYYRPTMRRLLDRIVSGGQTGADRAALAWALRRGVPHGGWCPKGRLAEDGVIPQTFALLETPTRIYEQRTRFNVRDSDATAVLAGREPLEGGALRTVELCREVGKPCLRLVASHLSPGEAAVMLRRFVERNRVRVLNVAGPRASAEPGIAAFVELVLDLAFDLDPRPARQAVAH